MKLLIIAVVLFSSFGLGMASAHYSLPAKARLSYLGAEK